MKTIHLISIVILVLTINLSHAQEVVLDSITYTVKGFKIFKNDTDVTDILTEEKRNNIFSKGTKMVNNEETTQTLKKEQLKKVKAQKEIEKDLKRAEKKQNQAEKALRKKEKAHSNFIKEKAKLKSFRKKYNKLKNNGKLSPDDELKWLKKIEAQKESISKAEKKLKRA